MLQMSFSKPTGSALLFLPTKIILTLADGEPITIQIPWPVVGDEFKVSKELKNDDWIVRLVLLKSLDDLFGLVNLIAS